ncbi:(+)-epi-alpha-bisabolol synthase [Phtheirospermum japonicum]|uniref:(+)-epi-alpha-bisabolol synthase n=1 Tax=Phtheirospermum japonicum TaxID=374723 RepID=A0A830CUW5_9LAMI|nr:(+)-epi-alpha-bisabolol synthase [Phtheirospermum japonicum]
MSAIERRSANYEPSIWNDEYVQSLNSVYREETFLQRSEKLKGEVIALLERTKDPLDQIEVVDILQRLGIIYHFTDYADRILKDINNLLVDSHGWEIDSLHANALSFRLLRQHGYNFSSEVFRNFMDESGKNFKTTACNDIKGLLSLYEASHLSTEGEGILDSAQVFSTHHLKQKLKQNINGNLADEIAHALEIPFHYRMLRLESRWFIGAYEKRPNMNPIMLELAKLDFNIVQAMYQDELKELSRWYTETRLSEKLSFARDRLVECFLWNVGSIFEPRFKYCRMISAKFAVLFTLIDDIYDVHGTLDELEMFTDVIERWDINSLEKLPEYMKICFLALFNTANEMAYDLLRDKGRTYWITLICRWQSFGKKYLVEAQWYHSGYKPSLDEFLSNGWISISGPLFIFFAYLCITDPLNDKSLEDLRRQPEILKWTSLVFRLLDDLGTSNDEMKRGDSPKSIQCYMHDTGCSEEVSCAYIKNLVSATWKKVNKDVLMNGEHSRDLVEASINLARTSQCMYQYGDGYGKPDRESKASVLSLVIDPISCQIKLSNTKRRLKLHKRLGIPNQRQKFHLLIKMPKSNSILYHSFM